MTGRKPEPLTGNAGDFSGIVLKAAARGDSRAVQEYLKVNPGWLNQEGPHGRTLLWEATYKGRTAMVSDLIEWGADVDPMGSYYTPMLVELSALAVAREAGNTEMVELLERNGARDDLYAACHRGDLNAIDHFLSSDPDAVNRPVRAVEPHPRMGYHPVHYAVAGKQLGALRLLVGYGAVVGSHLPLLVDWADGDRKIIRFLREQAKRDGTKPPKPPVGINVPPNTPAIDRPDWMGFPPLVDACRGNHNAPDDPERVLELLHKGANVNITDHKGKTPLHRSSQAGFVQITTLLLERGAHLETADNKGCTPVFDAAHYGRSEVLRLLIDRGVDLQHTDARRETPLFAAARGARPETFEILLEEGADLAHQNARGKTVADVVRGARHMTPARKRILEMIGRAQ